MAACGRRSPPVWAGSAVVTGFAATALTVRTEKTWRRLRRPQWPIFRLRDLTLPKWPAFLALPEPSKRRTAEKMTEVKMEAPKSPGTPHTPGQIERERRRKAREAEVNETPGKFGAGMPMPTGFLHNLHSTVAILREFVPSFKSNLTDVLDFEAPAATRISGAVSIGVKTAAAVVVAYFVYLEGLQLRSAAYKMWADACIERQKNAINFSTVSELYPARVQIVTSTRSAPLDDPPSRRPRCRAIGRNSPSPSSAAALS